MLTGRRLSLVHDIIVIGNSLKFCPIVITEVTVACDFSYFGRVNLTEKTHNTMDWIMLLLNFA